MNEDQKHQVAMLAAQAAKDRCGGDFNPIQGRSSGLSPAEAGRAVTSAYVAAMDGLTPKPAPAKAKRKAR